MRVPLNTGYPLRGQPEMRASSFGLCGTTSRKATSASKDSLRSEGIPPKRLDALVREEILAMQSYQTVAADGMIKLDAMESPYPLPAELKTQWLARLGAVQINRYPDPQCRAVKRMLRTTFGITKANELVLGNGSDELIQMIALLIGGSGRVLLAPTPTFSMYQLIAASTATEFISIPLRADFSLDGDALLKAIRQHQPACVLLAYPNNPSGNCFDESVIEQVLEQAPGLVVVDEAYFAFCGRSFIDRLEQFPDMLVLRTLSKSGMAALRLGFLVCHPQWATQLEKVRLPYNINSLTQCSAEFYLEQYATIQHQAEQIIAQRQSVFARLTDQPQLCTYPSEANFILFKLDQDAERIHTHLKQQGILVKNLHGAGSALQNCLRVTIGNASENEQFLAALQQSLSP